MGCALAVAIRPVALAIYLGLVILSVDSTLKIQRLDCPEEYSGRH